MIKELHITPLFVCQFDGSARAFFYVILVIKSNQITHHAETNSWYAQLSALRRNKIVIFLVWHKKTNERKAELIALIYTNLGFLGFWFLSTIFIWGLVEMIFCLSLNTKRSGIEFQSNVRNDALAVTKWNAALHLVIYGPIWPTATGTHASLLCSGLTVIACFN